MEPCSEESIKNTFIEDMVSKCLVDSIMNYQIGLKLKPKNKYTRKALKEKTLNELMRLYPQLTRDLKNNELKRIDYQNQTAFYNQAEAIPNFEYWGLFETLSIEQATALSLNKDPNTVTFEKISRIESELPFRKEYFLRYQLIQQAFSGVLTHQNLICAFDFIGWSIQKCIELPQSWVSVIIDKPKFKQHQEIQQINTKLEEEKAALESKIEELKNSSISTSNTDLHLVGMLYEYIDGTITNSKHPDFENITPFIEFLSQKYKGLRGASVRNLTDKLGKARQLVKTID